MFLFLAFSIILSETEAVEVNGTSIEEVCPEGWLDASFTNLGCLFFERTYMYWWDAQIACHGKDAFLVEVLNEEQLDFIRLKLKVNKECFIVSSQYQLIQEGEGQYGHHYWYAGGINTPEDDDWYWSTSGLPVGQFNWNPVGEEPDGVGDYLCYRTDLDYYGADCFGKQRSICQIATIT